MNEAATRFARVTLFSLEIFVHLERALAEQEQPPR